MNEIGRTIIIAGFLLVVVGIVMSFFENQTQIPKLPGDIYIKRDNVTFYFPLATSLLVSAILSLLLYFFRR